MPQNSSWSVGHSAREIIDDTWSWVRELMPKAGIVEEMRGAVTALTHRVDDIEKRLAKLEADGPVTKSR